MKRLKLLCIVCVLFSLVISACASNEKVNETKNDEAVDVVTTEAEASKTVINDVIRVAGLKGPTSMGIANLLKDEAFTIKDSIEFSMYAAADEIVAGIVKGDIDIAMVPANVASILYKKTESGIRVIDINTLGVLYIVDREGDVKDIKDIEGKKLYMTGKGTTPDYVLQYILKNSGVDINSVEIEFCSEPTEVISAMDSDKTAIGLLPQPFVTTAMMKDDSLKIALDLTKEWSKCSSESGLVTGVTIVRKAYLDENKDTVDEFIKAHKKSSDMAESNTEQTAKYIDELGIVGEQVALKALPYCSITCITGNEMQKKLAGYIQALLDMDPTTVGGSLPDNGFYYINE